jgi:hypothetical protein
MYAGAGTPAGPLGPVAGRPPGVCNIWMCTRMCTGHWGSCWGTQLHTREIVARGTCIKSGPTPVEWIDWKVDL